MSARTTMAWLITHVRNMIGDPGSEIWSDDEDIESFLDAYVEHISRVALKCDPDKRNYVSPYSWLEGSTSSWSGSGSVSDVINIWGSSSSNATAYTPDSFNLKNGIFTFDEDQDKDLWLQCRTYNVNMSAGMLMLAVGANPERAKKWSRGGIKHEISDPLKLAKLYFSMSGITSVPTYRGY